MWYKIAGVLCGFSPSGIWNHCSFLMEEFLCKAQSSKENSVLNNENLCILVDNSYWAFEGAPIFGSVIGAKWGPKEGGSLKSGKIILGRISVENVKIIIGRLV